MNSEQILEADRNFVCQLHQLRSRLDKRQRENEKRSRAQVLLRSAVSIFTLFMIAGGGYAIFHSQPEGESRGEIDMKAPPAKSQQPDQGTDRRLSPKRDQANIGTAPPAEGEHLAAKKIESDLQNTVVDLSETHETVVQKHMDQPANQTEIIAPVAADKDVEVVSTVVCGGVADRRPVDDRETFVVSESSRAYVWMEIWTETPPFAIKHVYYLNDQKYCEVPLDIKYIRMRTWSYVSLAKKELAGVWRVDAVQNDRVFNTVRFRVTVGDNTD